MGAQLGILLAITGGAVGQLLMKSGLQAINITDLSSMYYNIVNHPLPSLLILSGIACYVMSMFVWVYTLKSHPLNQAIPYLSLSYVLVYILATFWPGINEPATLQKSIGVSLILVGVWYTQSAPTKNDSALSGSTHNETMSLTDRPDTRTTNNSADKHAN